MDARLSFEGEHRAVDRSPSRSGAVPDPAAGRSSVRWNSRPDTDKWLAERHIGLPESGSRYRIEGWLAQCGTSVWFGAGSTGKTQLMLWMTAMLASRAEDRPSSTWLGGTINGSGHVLVLTAEDNREQVMGRLRDVVEHALGQAPDAMARTCARIHVMPFLSMAKGEFDHPNPSLFQNDRQLGWMPSAVLEEVGRYVREWNKLHPAVDDQIIGVVMDSATSMAGFDSMDAQATTNFFFYLGRLCEELRIFWAVIGHTPKTTTMNRKTYRATAPSRLRGVAMWTTAPRLTVEVRQVQTWREGRRTTQEAEDHLAWLPPGWRRDNLLVVYVAKANLKYSSRDERYLARQRHGAFVDVTDKPVAALTDGSLTGWEDIGGTGTEDGTSGNAATAAEDPMSQPPGGAARRTGRRPGRPKRPHSDFADATRLTSEIVRSSYPPSDRERPISINALWGTLMREHRGDPRAQLISSHSGGGKHHARPGAINWHLDRLVAEGRLSKRGKKFYVPADRPALAEADSPIA